MVQSDVAGGFSPHHQAIARQLGRMGQTKASVAGHSRNTGLDCSQVLDAHRDTEPLDPRQE